LLFILFPTNFTIADSSQWDDNWSYSQKILIPFDTSSYISHFQPIDTKVEFQNPCWAKDEKVHSVRVCCWDGRTWHELESQLYGLEPASNNIIKSCNVAFLIPEFADGKEEYFIFYDNSEKPSPDYEDHVQIEESYYKYEPISGYPLESHYYKITDDNYITYSISYDGKLMGYNTGQHVVKLKEKIEEVLPKNGELFAAFDFKYYYDEGIFSYSSTSQKVISKDVLIDGNLMVEFQIISTSNKEDLRTTAIYKYYHCPTTNTRIHVNVKHESLREIKVFDIPPATNADGIYASIQSGGLKSKSIKELNIGEILPFMHFQNEKGTISEYTLDLDPEYMPGNEDIRLISVEDDVDLGTEPWFSFDEGEAGSVHAVIFDSNKVVRSGTQEDDGLQLNAFELDYPHLPGLENNIATIQIGRNSVEPGKKHDMTIPDDFVVMFNADFFSSKNDGYKIVEQEAEIFRELVKIKPRITEGSSDEDEEKEKYDLSVFTHFAQSTPLGSSLSALLGLDLPYISVELYKNDEFLFSGNAVRLPIRAFEDLIDPTFIERIVSFLKIFDVRNISLFKKVTFPGLEEGKYVVKVFRENLILSEGRQFIGYAVVDLKGNKRIDVFCRHQAGLKVKVSDQEKNMVMGAMVLLQKDGETISANITDNNGFAVIKAPNYLKNYDLKIVYNGHTVYDKPVKLRILERLIFEEKYISLERYDFTINVFDKWGQVPDIELNPSISFKKNEELKDINAEKINDNSYIFRNLVPNTYSLSLTYKSFTINQVIDISENKEIDVNFPAEYEVNLNIFDSRGIPSGNSKIVVNRNDKSIVIDNTNPEKVLTIPPGEYSLQLYNDNELVGSRKINIYGSQSYDLFTNQKPIFPSAVLISCYILIFLCFIYLYYKRNLRFFIKILVVVLLILALFLPWWEINGSTTELNTSTKLYMIPNNMVTITSSQNIIAGEPSFLPEEFQMAVSVIIIFTLIGCCLLFFKDILKKMGKFRIYKIGKILTLLSVIVSMGIFIYALNELSSVSIGGIMGSGYLDISVPGEDKIHSVLLNWGPGIGFYIYLIPVLILLIAFIINIYMKRRIKNGQ
jgi:hypothetical protein